MADYPQGRPGPSAGVTLRGDRATVEPERICNSRISPKLRTIRYTKAVRDVAEVECRARTPAGVNRRHCRKLQTALTCADARST